jgi:hypothetical protein
MEFAMLDGIEPIDRTEDTYWSAAGQEFRRHIDDDIRARSPGHVLPWEKKVAMGQVDYWRVHAYALDRILELLPKALPWDADIIDHHTAWRGRHDKCSNWITVSLMTGRWFDSTASKRGDDLPGLIAHVYRMSRRRAAIRLAAMLGIEALRHD